MRCSHLQWTGPQGPHVLTHTRPCRGSGTTLISPRAFNPVTILALHRDMRRNSCSHFGYAPLFVPGISSAHILYVYNLTCQTRVCRRISINFILLVLNAGNFREWSISSLIIIIPASPPATHPFPAFSTSKISIVCEGSWSSWLLSDPRKISINYNS